jgi:glycosyltransferase involved in cell wall biosynthesis
MKLVSIGMPVFNDKFFLIKALESIVNQSYIHFELILSDDCSTDGSAQVCQDYALKDKRIKYIRQTQNIGISRNMEFLLRQATGDYFMWAGNDDLWHPDFILSNINCLENNPTTISAFCPYLFIDENDDALTDLVPKNRPYDSKNSLMRLLELAYYWDDGFGYGMFRREKIQNVKFPVWWGVNKKRAYNNIYPTLFYYLSLGEHKYINGIPMWYNRLKNDGNINHKVPYATSFLKGFTAFCLWKFNVYVKCTESVLRSGNISAILSLLIIIPFFICKYIKNVVGCLKNDLSALFKKQKRLI